MSVDAMIAVVQARGLRLNNLFQLESGIWQANVTDGTSYWEFGRADDPENAIKAALHMAATSPPEYVAPTVELAQEVPIRPSRSKPERIQQTVKQVSFEGAEI